MKNIIKTLTIGLFTLFTTILFANEDKQVTVDELQYDSDKQGSIIVSTDPENKWQDYLDKYGITEGLNKRNGSTFFIASYTNEVGALETDDHFIEKKDGAFKSAEISAKETLADYLGSWIVSDRKLTETEINDNVAISMKRAIIDPVSTAERAHKLTNLALDDQIRRFEPEWDGTNKTKEEKVSKVVYHNQRYVERISSRSRAYIQGASTIFTAEGVSDGVYSVVVGIVWSFKSAMVAESLYLDNPAPKNNKKNLISIKDRLNKLSDAELAATMGTRIWWDEKGLPVILSFSATDNIGLKSIIKKKIRARAKSQIAQFVSEIYASDTKTNTDTVLQAYKDGTIDSFTNTNFNAEVSARTKFNLKGAGTILYKKLIHPTTGKKMVVNVMSWSVDSIRSANNLQKMTQDQETKFNATKGGTVLGNSADQSLPAAGVATPGLEGVSSDPDDF